MLEGIERIKVLASEIKDKPLLKIVDYLISREDMNEKYLNEEKSLTQMIEFIKSSAQKEAKNGMAMIEDEVVYGWAIHYFDETNENLKLVKKETPKATTKGSNQEEKKTEIEKENIESREMPKTSKKSWVPEGQLSLFDI